VPSAPPARASLAAHNVVAMVPKIAHPPSPQAPKPRLLLVEETTGTGSGATPAPQVRRLSAPVPPKSEGRWFRLAAPASASLLVVALASLAVRGHESRAEPARSPRAAAEPPFEASTSQRTTVESPDAIAARNTAEAPPVSVEALPVASEPAQPAVAKSPTFARSGAPPPPAPLGVAPSTGVVFVTTPGGGGDVSERGRPLGHAPGTFRLGVGAHELSLRAPSGAVHTLHVEVQADAPTLVTVNGVQ
jgi:hypothetical protein